MYICESLRPATQSLERESGPSPGESIRYLQDALLIARQKQRGFGVVLNTDWAGGINDRLRAMFPDREFFMRSQGQVRFITISSRLQIVAAAVVAALVLAWLVAMASIAIAQFRSTRDQVALLEREAKVASAESRVSDYRDDLGKVAQDLERRQDFLEKMNSAYLDQPASGAPASDTVSDSRGEAARTVRKVSAALPEAAGLARIEARQLAYAERMTRHADLRAARAAERIRKLGLNPGAMLAARDDRSAQGGPLISLGLGHDALDQRFERLGLSLARMNALERGLAGIPQVLPASLEFISSGFGYRADPFTGGGAFHAGLDFRGPIGAPIYSAAKGRISFAGVKQGYGRCVEIEHGNGLMTRYAHMSRLGARVGQRVAAGEVIGAIGSTGRSTGPHLHFEVRIHDRAVNPRPFLEAAPHVLQDHRAGNAAPGQQ